MPYLINETIEYIDKLNTSSFIKCGEQYTVSFIDKYYSFITTEKELIISHHGTHSSYNTIEITILSELTTNTTLNISKTLYTTDGPNKNKIIVINNNNTFIEIDETFCLHLKTIISEIYKRHFLETTFTPKLLSNTLSLE
jgi:hypothetical protein